MLKKLLITFGLFAVLIYVLASPNGVCFEVLSRDLCNGEEKSVLLFWFFLFDAILLAYVASPFVHYGAMKFLVKARNTNK
jgi:hypothetical protein